MRVPIYTILTTWLLGIVGAVCVLIGVTGLSGTTPDPFLSEYGTIFLVLGIIIFMIGMFIGVAAACKEALEEDRPERTPEV